MAIKQIVPIQITLLGDGAATTFTYALANLYQAGVGGSIPFGTGGVVPSSVSINNPPLAVTSSTVDANGNITITFTTAPTIGVQYTLEVDLNYNSGAAASSSAVQSMNVNVTGGTITATESFAGATGSAVPASAAYFAGKNAGNLIAVAVDASGNVGVQQATAANLNATVVGTGTFAVQAAAILNAETTKVIGVVRNADGTGNLLTSTGAALDINLKTSSITLNTSDGNAAAQGSATSGQKGFMEMGAVTTGAPTYVAGQTSPLSLTTGGAIRVDASATTQPVSGTVAVSTVSGSVAVTGTFWQATQPISGSISNTTFAATQATASALNATVVGTGTFAVQATATQSGNWTSRIVGNGGATLDLAQGGANAATNAAQVAGVYNSSPLTLTTGQGAAMQLDASGFLKVNVSAGSSGNAAASATGSAVPALADFQGVNVAGTLRGWTAVNPSGSIYAAQIDLTSIAGSTTSTAATGVLKVGVVGSAGAVFDQATGSAVPANAIQVGGSDGTNLRAMSLNAKGTQGAYAVAVQELKDSGRTFVTWFVDAATLVISEALISVAVNKGGTLQGAATTYTVTSGKTFRLQSISASVQGSNSSVQSVKVRLRSAASVTSSSPIVAGLFVANSGATNSIGYGEMDFPDGVEIAAGQQIGISQLGGQVNGTVTVCVAGYEY